MDTNIDNSELPRQSVIIASNRGPVTLERDEEGSLQFRRGSGGLVTALMGLAGQIDVTWIACAQTEDDSEWREGTVPLAEKGQDIHMRFISPDAASYNGYYNIIANPLLWFLQHSMWDLPRAPVINRETWQAWEEGYIAVNQQIATEIAAQTEATETPVLVMVQDYHLYLVPRMVRNLLPPRQRPTILHFIHVPWPGPEDWRILPYKMRQAILEGLTGADLLGFQTREDALSFIRTCQTHMHRVGTNYKRSRVWYRNHATHVRDFPISIDVQALFRLAASPEVREYRTEIEDIVKDLDLIVRIDRIEPSKNIIRGFQAFEEMLDLYPEHCGQVIFLALLVPSRLDVDEYRSYLDELMATAGRVNARYGDHEWEPIRIIVGSNYPRAVAALHLYDVLLVNSIADGMNLVAKEGPIVNKRNGVLILSERTGARQQLEQEATVISPCDVYATAEALHQALIMPSRERRARARRLRQLVEGEDITDWLRNQLDAVGKLNL